MPSDQPLRLRVHAHPLTETPPPPVLLVGGAITVGRRDDNGWILPDQSASVSRRHATIEERNGRWCVIDDSANGTFLNGQMIGKGGVRPLTPGDVIKIGDYEVIVETSTDSGAPPMRSGMPGLPPAADPFGIGDLSRPEYGAPPPPPSGPSPFDPPPPERPLEGPRAADIFGDFGARDVAPGVGIGANPDTPLAALGGGIDSAIDGLGGGAPAFGGGADPFGAQRPPAGDGWGAPGAPSPGFGGGGLINDPLSAPGGGSAFGDPFGSANAIRDPLANAQGPRNDALGSSDPFSTPGGASVFGTDRGGSADSFGATPPPAPLGFDAVPIAPVSGPGSSALPSDWNSAPGAGLAPPPADLDPIEQALSGLGAGAGGAGAARPTPSGGAMPFGAAAALGAGALAGAAARPAPGGPPPSRPAPAPAPAAPAAPAGAQWLQSPPPGAAAGGLFGDASAGAEDPFSHPAAPAAAARAPRPATPVGAAMAPQGPPPQAFQHGAAPPPPAPARPMPAPVASPAAAAPAAASAGGDALLQAFIEGAGLREIPAGLDTVKAMRTLGSSTRAIVSTLARLLEARRLLKGEFRITQTVVGARENNPLKFSVDDSELMLVLLGAVRPGFQSGEAAVWDAGRDLEAHQVAMLSAFRATLDAVFARLSPEAVAAGEEAGFFGRVLPQARDAALWERYAKMHAEMRQDLGNTLAGRIGQIFAEAYEAENGRRGGSR
ncbi:MAG: type VI secretion system-associated FHA domain protein TagH [Rhodospirillales bacterium]|nr:MAG: type VI secretion system-associated FHA domain protein TagH [Rhodospirillales bacterium]